MWLDLWLSQSVIALGEVICASAKRMSTALPRALPTCHILNVTRKAHVYVASFTLQWPKPRQTRALGFLTVSNFHRRYSRLQNKIKEIEDAEKCDLADFGLGYTKFGFNRTKSGIQYREWAPAAQSISLIGEFSAWLFIY